MFKLKQDVPSANPRVLGSESVLAGPSAKTPGPLTEGAGHGAVVAWARRYGRDIMKRALVVDDEPSILRGMKVLLTLTGHDSVLAVDASQAMASEGVFDVGIFDLELGSECGIALARRMLGNGRVRRALFCTGCVDPERISRARSVARVFIKGEPIEPLLEAIGAQLPVARTCADAGRGAMQQDGGHPAGASHRQGQLPTGRHPPARRTETAGRLDGRARAL
jgi:DNA-binding NarL/FixJ family response regulator